MTQTKNEGSSGHALPHTSDTPTPSKSHPETAGLKPPSQLPRRPLQDVCIELRDRLDAFLAEEADTPLLKDVQAQLRISMAVVEEALGKFDLEQISLSYNGGKDCLVLLIVILASLARHFAPGPSDGSNGVSKTKFPSKLQAVYIVSSHPFSEVDDFVESSAAEYHLDVKRYILSMKTGLESYLQDRPNIKAIFVGMRRTDPHAENLKHFDPTDAGWPPFMRVCPVIDWHYAEIWAFIRRLNIPYCPLYDQGYTSLGGRDDTHPNPRLKESGDQRSSFRPAYELMEDDEERLGRER